MSPPVTWHAFDPDGTSALPDVLAGEGAVALVVSGDLAWSTSAVVALVGAAARAGQDVVVFDTVFEDPLLHGAFGVEPAPGGSDLIGFGASLGHVTRPVGQRLGLVPAGTVVFDAASVRTAPEWDAVIDALVDAGRTPVFVTAAGAAGGEAILARAERVVLVGDPSAAVTLGEARERLVLGLHRPGAEVPATEATPARDGRRAADPAARGGAAPNETSAAEADGAGRSRTRRRRKRPPAPQPRRVRKGRVTATFLLLALGVLAGSWWFGLIYVPGYGPERLGLPGGSLPTFGQVVALVRGAPTGAPDASGNASARTAPAGAAPSVDAPAAPEPEIIAPLLAWNLEVATFDEVTPALGQAAAFAAAVPELAFVVVPIPAPDSIVRFHLLAGPVGDSVAAEGLRPRLAAVGEPVVPGAMRVRSARLAFVLSQTSDRAVAERQRAGLELTGIPAHVLALPREDGSVVYRVYAGAFADASESAWLADLLARRSTSPPQLAARIGIPPA